MDEEDSETMGMGTATFRSTLRELQGTVAGQFDGPIAPDEALEFELFVPEPDREDAPPGVLVYVSPSSTGAIPPPWRAALRARNLIWIGAKDSGNEVDVARRVELALLGPIVAARHRQIDATRTYLVGFSGGGRVASMMMPFYPHVFSGAIFVCGANPTGFLEPHQLALMASHRLVFLTGTADFNLLDTQLAFSSFEQAGLEGARLAVVEGLGHELPRSDDIAEALSHLDRDSGSA